MIARYLRHTAALRGSILLAVLAAGAVCAQRPSPPIVAFEHVTVVPMDAERTLDRHTVMVQGTRITAVGPDGSVRLPAGAARVDGTGRYLMPGLADMHVHPYNTDQFINYLAHGVTTIAVLNGSLDALRWRDEVARGVRLGPTLYSAGPSLDGAPAGNPTFASTATPADGRLAVRTIASAGYDFVKSYMSLTPETYDAIVDEARNRRIAVVGHIAPSVGVDGVLARRGQVMVAHAEEFFREQVDSTRRAQRMIDIVRAVKSNGVTVTPNLSAYVDYIRSVHDLSEVLADPEMRYASPAAYSEKLPSHNRSIRPDPSRFLAGLERGLARFRTFTKLASDSGVPLLLGTDTEVFDVPGRSAHVELRELVAAGLSPYQALATGTRAPGAFIGRYVRGAEPFGTVAVGQRADLLLLTGNPLDSVSNVRRIEGVMVRGRWLPASRLAAMRDSVATRYTPLRAGVARFDSLVAARRLDDASATLEDLRRRSAGSPPVAQVVMWVKAQRLLQGQPAEAVRLLEWNTAMYPRSHGAHAALAQGRLAAGDTAGARVAARRALELFPTHAPAREILQRRGR